MSHDIDFLKRGSKRHGIGRLYVEGLSRREAYDHLKPLVTEQRRPWVFSANMSGGRIPKPMADQYLALNDEIGRVYALLDKLGNQPPSDHSTATENESVETVEDTPDDSEPDPEPEDEKPTAKGKGKKAEKEWFVSEWKRLRRWVTETAERSSAIPVDSLDSMRPIQGARACIDHGISAKAMLYAMCLHWSKASLEMAGVESVDFASECEPMGEGLHRLLGYVLKLAEARQNILLIGPPGTGKSRLLRQVAELIQTDEYPDGIPYAETPMTPGATRGDLLGRHTIARNPSVFEADGRSKVIPDVVEIEGFVGSEFARCYEHGGLFNLEELDAADASMVIVINNALASDRLYNSVTGRMIPKHRDFICAGTANTMMMGATTHHTGRDKQDLAVIDRFRMGRVFIPLDETLADYLMFGDLS